VIVDAGARRIATRAARGIFDLVGFRDVSDLRTEGDRTTCCGGLPCALAGLETSTSARTAAARIRVIIIGLY
jgi:hypothetical protein